MELQYLLSLAAFSYRRIAADTFCPKPNLYAVTSGVFNRTVLTRVGSRATAAPLRGLLTV